MNEKTMNVANQIYGYNSISNEAQIRGETQLMEHASQF